MSNSIMLECACGTVKGKLRIEPGSYFHVHCLCCDCQNFAKYLGNQEKILDKHGGSELLQTYPAFMEISSGHDSIACVQLHDKGLYRWHTTCCNMPIANTMSSSMVPFVGVSIKLMKFSDEQIKKEVIGPVTMKAFGKYAIGDVPDDVHTKFPLSYMPKIIAFMIKGIIKKKNIPSPFFIDKKLVAKVNTLPE